MPRAGVSEHPARRYAAPWWEELDREAFRFPAARETPSARASRPATPASRPAAPAARAPSPLLAPDRPTVTIRGRGADRDLPVVPPTLRRHERPGFSPDRAALWAVLLGLILILVAVASAHG